MHLLVKVFLGRATDSVQSRLHLRTLSSSAASSTLRLLSPVGLYCHRLHLGCVHSKDIQVMFSKVYDGFDMHRLMVFVDVKGDN